MAFSSAPLYLDPLNWQQQPNQQVLQGSGFGGNHHDQNQYPSPPAPPLPQLPTGQSHVGMGGGVGGGSGGSTIHPNSMFERARVARIHPCENQLPCPRCDSTNTKFCYYNNYSLTQPRHFCKACRRYWTNGGTLRNVPVGGGFRRNKKSSSKSSSGGGGSSSASKSSFIPPTTFVRENRLSLNMDLVSTSGLVPTIPVIPSAGRGTETSSVMASLQNISQLRMGNLGLSFGGALNAAPHSLGGFGGLTSGTHGGGGGGGNNHYSDFPQLNPSSTNSLHRFPNFLGGFQIPSSTNGAGKHTTSPYQNDQGIGGDQSDDNEQGINRLHNNYSSEINSQFSSIKTEGDKQKLNLHKHVINNNNATGNQIWAGNIENNTTDATSMWTDLSGVGSSSNA